MKNKLWTQRKEEFGVEAGIKGGGKGVHSDFFAKLVFEIAVAPQIRTRYRTFEGSRPQPPTGACGAATPICGPILVQLCQIT